jgi:hypothetical protein
MKHMASSARVSEFNWVNDRLVGMLVFIKNISLRLQAIQVVDQAGSRLRHEFFALRVFGREDPCSFAVSHCKRNARARFGGSGKVRPPAAARMVCGMTFHGEYNTC